MRMSYQYVILIFILIQNQQLNPKRFYFLLPKPARAFVKPVLITLRRVLTSAEVTL